MNKHRIDGRRIVLIGGAGFIGHHLAIALKAAGAEVSIIDSLQVNNLLMLAGNLEMVNRELYMYIVNQRLEILREHNIPIHVQDARDYHALSRLLTELRPQVIVQLAAVAHAGKANKDPYSTFDHSLRTLENALDNARGQIEHFIFFSSSMVYGDFPSSGIVTEEDRCEPKGIYGALKFAGEKMVIAYNQVFDLPYTIIRPSALYGERCISRRVGQIFIESAMSGLEVVVNGDGTDRLDFTYIGDLVNGVKLIIENDAARNQIFNLTYGQGRSLMDMAQIIRENFPGVQVKYETRDKLTPQRGTLSIDKARIMLGYEPQFPLEEGFVRYIQWYRSIWSSVAQPVQR